MIQGPEFDWCVPTNVSDEDLFEDMTSLPACKPLDV